MSKEHPRIIRNSAICLKCKTEIESKGRWDFKSCICGNLSVDGGKSYIKRCFGDWDAVQDTSIFDETQEPTDEDHDTL
jgi:hypothetical protein